MASQNADVRGRGLPNTRLPRRRGRGGISSALNMGPANLVHAVQAAQPSNSNAGFSLVAGILPSSSSSPTGVLSTTSSAATIAFASTSSAAGAGIPPASSSPKRISRVNQLRGPPPPPAGSNGHPSQQGHPAVTPYPANSRGRKSDANINILALTPNSSTLLVSPIGSSPMPGGRERHSRSLSQQRSVMNRRGPTLRSGFAYTPSREGLGGDAGLYGEGTSTAESSIVLSPMKLRVGGFGRRFENPADRSEVGLQSVESVDPEESGEYTEEDEDEDEEEAEEWGLVDRMRLWRHDAMTQHLYETAVFWGDKVMAWTNEPSDAFWLAQVYFQTGEYARAERLLTRPFAPSQSPIPTWDQDTDMHDGSPQMDIAGLPTSSSIGFGIQSQTTSSYAQGKHSFVTPHHPPGSSGGLGMSTGLGFGTGLFSSSRLPNGVGTYDHDPFLSSASGTTAGPSRVKQPGLMLPPPPASHSQKLQFPLSGDPVLSGFDGPDGDMQFTFPKLGDDEVLVPVVEDEKVRLDAENGRDTVRLVDLSVMCRYLAAQCQVRQGKWAEALEVLGEENPFRDVGESGPHVASRDGGIKLEASMCHLRGVLYMRLNRTERAKMCFLESLALDVKCFESFNTLLQYHMLTVEEEWELIQGLRFQEQTPEDGEFIRLMYTIRLKKVKYGERISLARRRLTEEYGLGNNCDILYTLADSLYAQLRFANCFVVTSRIMEISGIHIATVPLHVACMYHLKHLHSRLFLLAHELVDKEPESPTSWYAVGIWYLAINSWREAKQHLSKTTIMDSRHAPGWIAFAHTFAKEGEHEHAITAYSTCARLFKGSHLPHLFIGMEQLTLSHLILASEALEAAHSMCDSDPLVFNERGVVAYLKKDYQTAVQMFDKALSLGLTSQGYDENWIPTYCNLGTAHRRLGNFSAAKDAYRKVLLIDPCHANALASLGMVYHMSGEFQEAIQQYHEALSVDPLHSNVLELLNMALESGAAQPLKVPVISEKVALATQIQTEKENDYMRRSKEKDADEKVGWDIPFGEPSAWTV